MSPFVPCHLGILQLFVRLVGQLHHLASKASHLLVFGDAGHGGPHDRLGAANGRLRLSRLALVDHGVALLWREKVVDNKDVRLLVDQLKPYIRGWVGSQRMTWVVGGCVEMCLDCWGVQIQNVHE